MERQDRNTGLARLEDLDGWKVADGSQDVKGWDVVASDGQKVGEVDHLIADPAARRVRYLEVELDRKFRRSGSDNNVLVPIGAAQLDDDKDMVRLSTMSSTEVGSLPVFGRGTAITREYETSVRDRFGGSTAGAAGATAATAGATASTRGDRDFYDHDAYDDSRFGRGKDAESRRLTLAEEELALGKRQVQAGEVELRKTVETEHVRQQVPVTREEVTVERRPVAADSPTNAAIGEDEIRVPIMEEQVVVEKRVVPVEEVVIKKTAKQEDKTVEADLRRERLVVDKDTEGNVRDSTRGATGAAGAAGSDVKRGAENLGDKIARGVDDVKDRVDGNPASRPGPDQTDRRP